MHSVSLLPPSGKYTTLLDSYIHFSKPERVRNLKTSFIPPSSNCPSHPPFPVSSRVSFPHYTACILKAHVLLFPARNNAHTAHLDVSPQHIADCLCCFQCPILNLVIISCSFLLFPLLLGELILLWTEKNIPPKTPLLCPLLVSFLSVSSFSQLPDRTPFIGWSSL